MKHEDFEGFIKMLPRVSFMAKQDSTVRQFAREYRQETVQILAMLSRLGLAGGMTSLHPAPPSSCDHCGRKLSRYEIFVDGQTDTGTWANMCFLCFSHHGEGLGWGIGQLYWAVGDGKWRLVAGADPGAIEQEGA